MGSFKPPGVCPVCGAFVERGARACRDCGSSDETGWSEEAAYDGLDLPGDPDQDLGEPPRAGIPAWAILTALLLVAVLASVLLGEQQP